MKLFAISDLHLSTVTPKPMDVFGDNWAEYTERIENNWKNKVSDEDLVLIPGDISWAMSYMDAMADLEWIDRLPGRKILLRGNHDYWWAGISSMRSTFPSSIFAVQNDCLRFGNTLIAGTRLWTVPECGVTQSPDDRKIYLRELERLRLTLNAMQKQRRDGDFVCVMTHYPPFNSRMAKSDYVELILEYRPDVVVYGHLHGKGCFRQLDKTIDGVKFLLTSCDQISFDPIEIKE